MTDETYVGTDFGLPYFERMRETKKSPSYQFRSLDPDMSYEWVNDTGDIPDFDYWQEYRFAPVKNTVTVYTKDGPVELPAPEKVAPDVGTEFFNGTSGEVYELLWRDNHADRFNLRLGNVFLRREDAQAWADFQAKQRRGEL